MTQAFSYFWEIFHNIVNFFFNSMSFTYGQETVSVGYIMMIVSIIAVIVTFLLNINKGVHLRGRGGSHAKHTD